MITNLTAAIIRNNGDDISCYAGGPVDGKYCGWICFNEDRGTFASGGRDIRPRPLLSTEPIYDSREEAVDAMQKIVNEVRQGAMGNPKAY